MKELSIQLNQKYKSFNDKFNVSFEGDLVILSGINGSGKSQLIDIISQREGSNNRKIVATIKLNSTQITRSDILRRSFKDNVNVPEFTHAGTENIKSHTGHVWNAYHSYRLDFNNEALWNFKESCKLAKKNLIDKFGEQKFKNNQITQLQVNDALPASFVWKPDDIFTNFIGELFFNYATDVFEARAKAGDTVKKFNPSLLPTPPWKQLNELFSDLNFEYRFKDYYFIEKGFQINEQPCLYQIKNNEDIDETQPRKLADLSDGEKAIISLSFASLSGVKNENRKVLLLDEFDANFNPSLTEIFYNILDKYFVSQGVLVVIATHSPTTISLAPDSASFYEVFKQNAILSKRILPVQKDSYAELKVANKDFYIKISNQTSRIAELEKENSTLSKIENSDRPSVVVEDKYDQIYKIAWLKLNDIEYENENQINEKFDEKAVFHFFGFESAGSVAGLLRTNNTDFYIGKKIIGLFDFDEEGSEHFYHLQKSQYGWDNNILGDQKQGYYKKRNDHDCFYALLLPIPDALKDKVSDICVGNFKSLVEIENLLPENFLIKNNFCTKEKVLNCEYLKVRDDKKNKIWKKLNDLNKDDFKNFKPLFEKIDSIIN